MLCTHGNIDFKGYVDSAPKPIQMEWKHTVVHMCTQDSNMFKQDRYTFKHDARLDGSAKEHSNEVVGASIRSNMFFASAWHIVNRAHTLH